MQFSYTEGSANVNYLTAPYELLVKAFESKGTENATDDGKCMAQWFVNTLNGEVEVYDYKVGKSYDPNGLEVHEITDWHVQGEPAAIGSMLAVLSRHATQVPA